MGVLDAGTKAAIAEQLQLGEQLKRKIEGRGSGSDDSDGDYSTEARWGPAACCLLPAACCLLPAACCLLPAACCLLPATFGLNS